MRALGTAKNVHDYAIPGAGSDLEIDKFGFSLKGWIVDDNSDQGLDKQDRWGGGIHFPPPAPMHQIVDAMELDTDSDRRLWKNSESSVVMASQVWGHYDEARRSERQDPERGSRLQASMDFLKEFLSKLSCDLIIEVQISRWRRHRQHENKARDKKERIPTSAKLYVLGADGQFRTF